MDMAYRLTVGQSRLVQHNLRVIQLSRGRVQPGIRQHKRTTQNIHTDTNEHIYGTHRPTVYCTCIRGCRFE